MKTSKFRFPTLLLGMALGAGLAGCDRCEGIACSPCTRTDNVNIYVDTNSSPGGFSSAEINGIYLVRYTSPGFMQPLDTVRTGLCSSNLFCFIGLESYPIPGTQNVLGSRELPNYNFRFVLPNAGRTFDISNIEVQSEGPSGRGCCDCGQNVRRRLLLNGVPMADDGNGSGRGFALRR
jgi:hypothetical protein